MKLADQIILHIMKHGRKDPSEIMIPNFYHFGYEMDVFKLMKTGYVVEYEVKISRADYYNDFKKMREKYDYSEGWDNKTVNKTFKHDLIREAKGCNRFFFVVPKDLIKPEEVPGHCGLMYYNGNIETIKPAPLIHKQEFTDYKSLASSLSWRETHWRSKIIK